MEMHEFGRILAGGSCILFWSPDDEMGPLNNRRRPYQGSLREALLGRQKETNLVPQQDFILIEDDEEPVGNLKGPQVTSLKTDEPGSESRDIAEVDTETENEKDQDGRSSVLEEKGKKRPIEAVERSDETEASTHLARKTKHQESLGEMTCRQSAVDTVLEKSQTELGVASC
ncbi:hypothetical protein FOBRF1_013140 [Fusarium oxysporum]